MTAPHEHEVMRATATDLHKIEAYLRYLRQAGHPETTITTYRSPLMTAATQLPHGLQATGDEIADWLGAPGRSRNTRAAYGVALRGFYKWCVSTNRIDPDDDPMAELRTVSARRGLPRPVPLDQVARILTAADEPYRLWCLVAATAGARCIEISRLAVDHVTEAVTLLWGKGDKERAVPTHPDLWAAVRNLPPGLLAGGASPKRVSDNIARACDRIGLPDVTAHRLRHTAGTIWQQATGDVRVTQQLLGHADVSTTQVYTAVSDAGMRAAVLAMPRLTGGGSGATGRGAVPAA